MRTILGAWWERTRTVLGLATVAMFVCGGCVSYEPPQGQRRESPFAELIRQERSDAGEAAKRTYENTGEVPLLGPKPQCVEKVPPCSVEKARWEVVKYYREWLFDSILSCEPGQSECEKVRQSESAMRKLVYRRWKNERDLKQQREAERRAYNEERLRAEEEVKLFEWRRIQEEEQQARDEASTQQLASIPPAVSPPVRSVPHDWHAEARAIVRTLLSSRIGCSGSFGETQFVDRVWALSTLDAMGQGDAARIEATVDASHGSGTFQRLLVAAREEVQRFVPRRCIAGL